MMFLIFQMFIYLVLAAGIGLAAGWLLRNLQAQQMEERARREMHDTKAKMPQLESLLRGRDEQIVKLKEEIKGQRQDLKGAIQATKEAEKALVEQKRETNRWKQNAETKQPLSLDTEDDGNADELISELSREISQLKAELAKRPEHSGGGDNEVLAAELDAARLENQQLTKAVRAANDDLDRQRRAVTELERERELQNKSLQVLHQQLEMERSSRIANG